VIVLVHYDANQEPLGLWWLPEDYSAPVGFYRPGVDSYKAQGRQTVMAPLGLPEKFSRDEWSDWLQHLGQRISPTINLISEDTGDETPTSYFRRKLS
jgi:hypothetical protein